MAPDKIVIVGAGLAGVSAAESLRDEGFTGSISIVGAERHPPYQRPPLSKGFLQGRTGIEDIYVHPPQFYADHQVELVLGTRIAHVRPDRSQVEAEGGEVFSYDRLLLAPGARPRRLPIPGAELDRVHYLRDISDAQAIQRNMGAARHVVVVGAGWIGCEVAASARQSGLEVTVIDPLSVPLERVLGPDVGLLWRDLHVSHGVRMLLGTGVGSFQGDGHVERVILSDGRSIDADLVVVGVGVVPSVEFAADVLRTDNGILVDELLQTSVPGIFAGGDVANAPHPLFARRLRVEHWATARDHGRAVARSMLGKGTPYDVLPSFYSDQYGLSLQYWGHASSWDDVVLRGTLDDRNLIALWLRDGKVLAGMGVGAPDAGGPIEQLIRSQSTVDTDKLRDLDTPLADAASRRHGGTPVKEFVAGGTNYARRFMQARFTKADATPAAEVAPGEGKVLQVGAEKLAVYRTEDGQLNAVSAVCTHLGCLVEWNPGDKVWDCHCHDARFARDGKVLRGPATKDLDPRRLPSKGSD